MAEEGHRSAQRTPVFFLSYARARPRVGDLTRQSGDKLYQLFQDLSMHVYELMGLEAGASAGFMDRTLGGGQAWTHEVAAAVGHCQVFVPLISAQYLNSAWCAREWDAFARRRVVPVAGSRAAGARPLLPVVWSAVEDRRVPPKVAEVELFQPVGLPDGSINAMYRQEGLYGLLSLGTIGRDAYQAVVWRLAQHVVRLAYDFHVEPRVPDLNALHASFDEDPA